jgi:hypothetical protein
MTTFFRAALFVTGCASFMACGGSSHSSDLCENDWSSATPGTNENVSGTLGGLPVHLLLGGFSYGAGPIPSQGAVAWRADGALYGTGSTPSSLTFSAFGEGTFANNQLMVPRYGYIRTQNIGQCGGGVYCMGPQSSFSTGTDNGTVLVYFTGAQTSGDFSGQVTFLEVVNGVPSAPVLYCPGSGASLTYQASTQTYTVNLPHLGRIGTCDESTGETADLLTVQGG